MSSKVPIKAFKDKGNALSELVDSGISGDRTIEKRSYGPEPREDESGDFVKYYINMKVTKEFRQKLGILRSVETRPLGTVPRTALEEYMARFE